MTLLFNPWVLLGVVLYSLALVAGGGYEGYHVADQKWQTVRAKEQTEFAQRLLKAQEGSTVVVTQYVKGDFEIRTVYQDRIKYIEKMVPHEVIVESDRACGPLPAWVVGLWNSANEGRVPEATAGIDVRPTALVLSDVTAEHEREAELGRRYEEQNHALKDWIRSQYEAINKEKLGY